MIMPSYDTLHVIIPALDEEDCIAHVISALQQQGIHHIIVVDNGSSDRTIEVAEKAGARVVSAAQKGYGSACLTGIAALSNDCETVLFCDGDGADDLRAVHDLCQPVITGTYDMVIGSRVRGSTGNGALTWPQRMGNIVASFLMRLLYRVPVTDLGPFRCIRRSALDQLDMQDPAFGWTAEMQVKAYRWSLRCAELPVHAQVRIAGESKISGRIIPVFKAGWAIISTILYYHRKKIAGLEKNDTHIQSQTLPFVLEKACDAST